MILDSNKTRLIIFLPNFSYGGASKSIFKLCKFLSKKEFSILVVSIGKNFFKQNLIENNCEVIELKSSRVLFSIIDIRKIIKDNNKLNFKKIIFISNIHYANIISSIAIFGIKNIILILIERTSLNELKIKFNLQSYIKNIIILNLIKYFYKKANLIITNSIFEKKFIKKNFLIRKIKVIYPPTIKKILSPKKITSNKKKNIINIIYVGRLSKEKGINLIVKALALLKNKYNFIFNIIGEGPLKKEILKLVDKLNLKNNVKLKGRIVNVNNIYNKADLFINASYFEGLPNAIVESMNHGVPIICSNSPGGNMEVIKNGEFGIYFKSGDYFDLKNKIDNFLEKKTRLINISKLNRKFLERFLEKKNFEEYLRIFKNI
jgi:glycosyltransferase involved in cell wall biosynthesis